MSQINRYLLSNLTVATVFVTAGLSAAIWLTQSLRLVELVVEGGAPLMVFAKLAILTLPTFLSLVLPLGLLCAVLFIYNRLIMDSELVVMRAVGMSPLALARPALILACVTTLICFALTLYVAPAAQRELVRLRQEVRSDYTAVLLREGTFNDVGEGLTVYVRERGQNGDLRGLLIHDLRTADQVTTVVADRGQMVDIDNVPRVLVFNGTQMKYKPATGETEWLEFARYAIDLQVLRKEFGPRWVEPRERGIGQLLTVTNDPVDKMFSARLRAELHTRLATPLLPLAFVGVALAALLPGQFSRKGQPKRIALAAVGALVLESAVLGLSNVVGKNPVLVPLLYAVILLPVAAGLFYVMRWRALRRMFLRTATAP